MNPEFVKKYAHLNGRRTVERSDFETTADYLEFLVDQLENTIKKHELRKDQLLKEIEQYDTLLKSNKKEIEVYKSDIKKLIE